MLNGIRRSLVSGVASPALVVAAAIGAPCAVLAQVQIGSTFNSQGPAPAAGPRAAIGSADNPPNGTATGAIEAIAADPGDPNTIYVGAVNGGIWKSINGGQTWVPLTDKLSSLSIGSMSLDPTDPTRRTLIAGIGNTSNGGFTSISTFSTPANFGGVQNGLLFSTDGGATFTHLGGATLSGQSVIGVQARGGTMLAATFEPRAAEAGGSSFTGGLFRSTNGGATFTQVSGAGGSGLPLGPVTSLVGDPANPNVFYAAVTATGAGTFGQTAVYKSTDGGATWAPVFAAAQSGGTITTTFQTTITLAAGPGGTVAAGVVRLNTGQLTGLFYSNNGGTTFAQTVTPNVNPGGMAPVNLVLAIDPTSTNLIYVAGDNRFTLNGGFNSLAIERVNTTTNTSTVMVDDTNTPVNTANGSTVHPDGRALVIDASGRLLTGSDGGIYARTNPQNNTGVWQGLNGNISVMELYSLAYDGNSKRLVIAAQDNGNSFQASPGGGVYNQLNAGDGINARVNDQTFGTSSAIYTTSQFLGQATRRIVDLQGNITNTAPITFTPNIYATDPNIRFTSPFILNNVDKSRVAIGTANVYVGQDNNPAGAATANIPLTDLGSAGVFITTIDYGTRNNVNALVAGGGFFDNPAGRVLLSTTGTAGSLVNLPAYTGLAPTAVKFDERAFSRFFVADSQNLYGTVNTGVTFQNLTGNLPANFIRPTSLGFIDNNGVEALLVGGLNNADNAGNPLVVADSDAAGNLSGWRRFGSGLPNVTVYGLNYDAKTDALAIGTIGRGAFLLYDVTSNFASATVLQFGLANNDSIPDPAILFGNRPLIKYGPGTLTIGGPSTYTGFTNVLGGSMVAGAANVFAPTSAFTISAGARLNLNNFNQTIGSLAGAGNVTLGSGTLTTGGDNTSTSFSGVISGPGGLVKAGTGVFTLSGPNTYTGPTTVNAGTLQAGAVNTFAPKSAFTVAGGASLDLNNFNQTIGSLAGAGNVTLGSGTLTTGGDNTSTLFSGVTSGTGGLVKTGTGVFGLTGANTYTGGTTINAGALQLGNGGALGAIVGDVTDNGFLIFNRSDAFTFPGIISGSGQVVQSGTGTTTLTGANTYSGGTSIFAGTLAGSVTSFGSGPILDNATLVLDQPIDADFANSIAGSGALTKRGAGSLNLTGDSPLSGPTTVETGRLAVNGSLANSIVTVQGGATLGGNGTVGGILAQGGSTIAPGNSIGTLSVNGNVTFLPNSIYQVEVNAAGQNDRINATGTATLLGGTVQVLAAQGNYLPQTRYTILTANAGVSGRFGATFTNLAFLVPELAYDPNNVFLVLTRNDLTFASAACNPSQALVGAAVDKAFRFGTPIYNALVGATRIEACSAFNQLSGELHAHVATTLFHDSDLVRQAVLGRLRNGLGFGFGETAPAFATYSADAAGGPAPVAITLPSLDPKVFALWGQGFGSWGRDRTDHVAAALDRSTAGFVLGADATLEGRVRTGLAGGYYRTTLDLDERLSSGSISSGFGALYAGAALGALSVRLGAAYAEHRIETTRGIAFRSFLDRARTDYDGSTAQAFGELGYRIDLDPFALGSFGGRTVLEPFVGAAALRIHTDRYAEDGGPAALVGFGRTHDLGTVTAGLRSEMQLGHGSPFVLRSMLGWRGAFGNLDPSALHAFRLSGSDVAPFTVTAVPIDRSSLVTETGLDWKLTSAMTLGVSYAGAFGERSHDNAVKGRFEYRF